MIEPIIAIVIPAYKATFLSQTLDALVDQTNPEFNVYIGNDNSSDNIELIVKNFIDRLNIHYVAFESNLGLTSLVKQWERCIRLSRNEKWLWLLPDDDVPSPECIATFLDIVKNDSGDEKLYRFQSIHIDENNKIIFIPNQCPPLESNIDFVIKKLKFERNSSVAEYIFEKQQFYHMGGFVDLPLAWGSDDLLWITLSQKNDIVTLPRGLVQLRQSKLNISSNTTQYAMLKIEAKYQYFRYLLSLKSFISKLELNYPLLLFKRDIATHLFYEYKSHCISFSILNMFSFALKNKRIIGGGFIINLYRLLRYQLKLR